MINIIVVITLLYNDCYEKSQIIVDEIYEYMTSNCYLVHLDVAVGIAGDNMTMLNFRFHTLI